MPYVVVYVAVSQLLMHLTSTMLSFKQGLWIMHTIYKRSKDARYIT